MMILSIIHVCLTHHIFVYELSFVFNLISTVTYFAMFLEQTFKETHFTDAQATFIATIYLPFHPQKMTPYDNATLFYNFFFGME